MSTGDQGSRLLSEQVSPVLGYRNGSRRCRVHITGRSDWNPWSRRRRIAEWEWRETIRFHLIHPIVSFTGSLLYEASSGSSTSAVGLVSNADGTNGTARNVARHVATRWTCVCGSAVACANAGATSIQRWPSTEVDRTVETIEQGSLESSHPRATAFAAEMAGVRWCTIGVVELLAALSAASLSSLPSLGGMVGVSTTSSPSIPTSVSFTASRCMSASSATAAACWVLVLGLAWLWLKSVWPPCYHLCCSGSASCCCSWCCCCSCWRSRRRLRRPTRCVLVIGSASAVLLAHVHGRVVSSSLD